MKKNLLRPAIVLVADRTLNADYKILFEGMFATMQTTQVPEFFMRSFMAPPVSVDAAGRAKTAPLGLRRVESAIVNSGTAGAEDVVCTTPEALQNLLGPWVKVVGVSSSDYLGMGMSNTTTANFCKGELYTRRWTRRLLESISCAKHKYGFKVVAGGAGAWQLVNFDDDTVKKTVDVVYEGYFESAGPGVFAKLLKGLDVPGHIQVPDTSAERIQPIRSASLMGIVELSRGCGRGCRFCTMAEKKMEHLPPELILSDLQTNFSHGITTVVSGSEDFFRYGATGIKPDFDRLHDLLLKMRSIKGLSFMQIDHANITSVAQLTDEQLGEIRDLLSWERKSEYLWVNMGVESAAGHLVARGCRGKIAPFRPQDWPDIVKETAERMNRNGYFPVFSIILGLPGETPDDVDRTLKLVRFLGEKRAVIFPIFYEPLQPEDIKAGQRFTVRDMSAEHLELFKTCYEINFRLVPKLFMDNQRAAGVGFVKRTMMQLLGKGEIISWRMAFRKTQKQITGRQPVGEPGYAG